MHEAGVSVSGLSARLLGVDSEDPRTARRGRNALIVFYGVIACGVPSAVALFFIPHGPGLSVIITVFCVIAVLCTLLVRRGAVDLGIGLFFLAMLGAELAFPLVSQDSRLTAVYLVIPVAIAGVTLERRGLLVVALASMTVAVVVTLVYPPVDPPPTTFEVILAALVLTGFLLVVTWLGDDSLRRHADHELPRLLAAAERYGHPMAMAMADLDHFKSVNDDFTYAVGDEVLRRFAQILTNTCRATDVVTRYGGEEFLVMMPQTNVEQGYVVCERLRLEVERHPWQEVVDSLEVTVSIGLADSEHSGGLVTLVAASDTALHRAKREGRNRVVATSGEALTRPVARIGEHGQPSAKEA